MNRRTFLRRGLWGSAILALSGVGLASWPSLLERRPRQPLKLVDERGFAVLAAVAARTVRAPGADPIAIAHAVDDTLSRTPPEAQKEFCQLLAVLASALAGRNFRGPPEPFSPPPPRGPARGPAP